VCDIINASLSTNIRNFKQAMFQLAPSLYHLHHYVNPLSYPFHRDIDYFLVSSYICVILIRRMGCLMNHQCAPIMNRYYIAVHSEVLGHKNNYWDVVSVDRDRHYYGAEIWFCKRFLMHFACCMHVRWYLVVLEVSVLPSEILSSNAEVRRVYQPGQISVQKCLCLVG
jgi:hypothetical protein